jgi:TolB-like protein
MNISMQIYSSQKLFCRFLLTVLLILPSGCAKFNGTPLERFIGGEADLIAFSYTIADELTEAAFPPLVPRHPDMPLLVTTFVDNNDLKKTSKFGRILQEHTSSRLVQLGYAVKEIKMTGRLLIEEESGESILSRDLSKIAPSMKTQAILVGTISYTNRTMYISARLVNPVNNVILSSGDYRLIMDNTVLAMFGMQRDDNGSEIKEPRRSLLNSLLF